MRNIHSTTGNPTTYLRMLLEAGLAFGIATLVPYAGPEALDYIAPRAVNLGILFSITVGFLMYKSLNRRSEIDNYIAMELNKVRRLYHLAQHIQRSTAGTEAWFAAVKGSIREYLGLFRTFTFHEYELGSPMFRSITYAIYSLPGQTKNYPPQLYQSLLDATADSTLAREYIRANKDDQVSLFSWIVVSVISLTFAGIITMATPPDPVLRAVGASVIFCMFLVLQLIFEHDRNNPKRERAWARRYVADLESLDHAEKMR
jgi:hypothetical protein